MRRNGTFGLLVSTTAAVAALSIWFLKKRASKKRKKKHEQLPPLHEQPPPLQAQEKDEKKKKGGLNPKTVEWYPPKQSQKSNLSATAKEFIPARSSDYDFGEFRTPSKTFRSDYSSCGIYTEYPSDKFQINYPHERLVTDYTPSPPPSGKLTSYPPSETTLSVAAPPFYPEHEQCHDCEKSMYIMRGLPGSGKSTLAGNLLRNSVVGHTHSIAAHGNSQTSEIDNKVTPRGTTGIILSTDDFFLQKDGSYVYNADFIVEAHRWNQQRTYAALCEGKSPIIIDNTMTQKWEAKWYVRSALKHGYKIIFVEPKTSWAKNPRKLARKNRHGVSREKIKEMLERWEDDFTIPSIINSVETRNYKINVKKRRNRRRK